MLKRKDSNFYHDTPGPRLIAKQERPWRQDREPQEFLGLAGVLRQAERLFRLDQLSSRGRTMQVPVINDRSG